jgi:mannose-6-phosphate isomerase
MISRLQPNRVRRSYLGGSRIDAFCGRGGASRLQACNNKEPPRPEDWLASTTQAFNGTQEIEGEGLGRIEDGRLVRDVVGPLPILVKLLDSDERLVVQAHPTVPCAKRLFNSPVGKTECWYFLPGTAPDACVYLGFKPGITRESWEKAVCDFSHKEHKEHKEISASLRLCVENNPLLQFLHRIPVSPGDFVFVDGGVPHAIGGGCFMIELQEPSDLMVVAERFTPSGRRIPDAKMHGGVGWDKMFDVYEYEGRTYEETCAKYVRRGCASARICGPEFTDKFEMWRIADGGTVALDGASAVVVVTDGDGLLNDHPASRGDRIIVSGESILCSRGTLSAVVCFLP